MSFTYRIKSLVGMPNTESPPAIVSAVFPDFNGEPVSVTSDEVLVTFATEQTPADLGPLVKVERIS